MSASPYLGWPGRKTLSRFNQFSLGLYWLPHNVLWTGLLLIVLPHRVLQLAGPAHATAVLSWTSLAGVAVAICTLPIFGAISDNWRSRLGRRRPLLILGTVPALASLLLIAYAPSIPLLVLGLLGVQCFSNIALSAYQGLIPDLVPPAQRGAASGTMGLFNELGVIAGGVLGAFTAAAVFAWSVTAGLVCALLATVWLVKEPSSTHLRPQTSYGAHALRLLRDDAYRSFRWVWVTRLCVLVGLYVLESYLLYYLKFVLGLAHARTDVFLLLILLSVTGLISALVCGLISDRLQRRRLIVCAAGLLQGLCALLFVFSHSLVMIELAAAIFGIGYGAFQAVDWALVVDTLPSESAAKDMGVWSVTSSGSQLIALFFGFVVAQALIPSIGTAPSYRWLFAAAALFFVVGSLFIWKVRRVA